MDKPLAGADDAAERDQEWGVMKLRFGLIGGGEGAFIGQVHRIAAELDGLAELVCGTFGSTPERSQRAGPAIYGLPQARCYGTFAAMFAAEQALPAGERMQFVVIATPNHVHCEAALGALDAGFHVVCDKPLCLDLQQALELERAVAASGLEFAVTYNYTGYPMLKEAQALVASGALGALRRVQCEYLQGWLAQPQGDNKQADWRTDPARAGLAGAFGDIGSHAENLIRFVSGLDIVEVCADLTTFVPGRALDDDGNVLLRLSGGARGVMSISQVAVGRENGLALAVYGERGSLRWQQRDANSLSVRWLDGPEELRRSGSAGLSAEATAAARLPAGHPEGYLEAFANIYRQFYARLGGSAAAEFPGIDAGVAGMRFIDAVVRSSAAGAWLPLSTQP